MSAQKKQILITGGSGFIGTYLCHELLRNGHEVTVLDLVPAPIQNKGAMTDAAATVDVLLTLPPQVPSKANLEIANVSGVNLPMLGLRRTPTGELRLAVKRLMDIAIQRYYGHYLTERLLTNLPIPEGALPRICGEGSVNLGLITEVSHVTLTTHLDGIRYERVAHPVHQRGVAASVAAEQQHHLGPVGQERAAKAVLQPGA